MSDTAEQRWSVYLIRNNRNALYCGVTNNVERRFNQHQSGKGAKALKGKGPLVLEWSCAFENKSMAMKAEYFIKQLTKTKKELLVQESGAIQVGEDQSLVFYLCKKVGAR
ncbi:GIY-YIG nuclease family protein [Vibrio campbellii]|uniref:GIY-YIG nuclease family protein n=1 Tax=Vibrio campbellii TaxID=680 RepID=A0AAE9N4W6_9VIBR|nr:GIY-YIG nuclease family protein [Vibrio campbellii]UTZ24443.1 GIY-YIG nuclease family protein [Vibrio campbellii]UTZ28668.1 GIY-YIG nuclease family protein [Vibrio campbellii]UTZ33420.1 GIY-YIG nuclease family protein [Vibrio campbellii]UTZ43147.1 GIY-YIG nuclease family protein [Vibrio campbellii]